MPPKRKQATNDDSAPAASSSTRSTRSSTKPNAGTAKNTAKESASSKKTNARKATSRASASTAAASTSSTNEGDNGADSDAMEVIPPAKKARTSAASAKKAAEKQSAGRRGGRTEIDDEIPGKSSAVKEYLPTPSNRTPVAHVAATHAPAKKPANKTTKYEPYTPQRALELFSTYADSDPPTVIGHEGFERLCTDASLPMEGARPIILSWLMGAKEMGNVTQAEWVAFTSSLKISYVSQLALAISELEDLLIQGKAPIKTAAKKDQEYDRTVYLSYESNPKAAFRKLYQFIFALAKPEQSRNIDMETSVAFWTVLLVPKYPIMSEVLSFISEKSTYRATNKDLWTMMLEFCETVKPNLQDYEADGAWPTLLDDFVLWKKGHGNGVAENTGNAY